MNIVAFVITCGLLLFLLTLFLPTSRSRKQSGASADESQNTGPIYRDDDRYWYGGIFYNNPDDPDAFVPKRYGLGWTINVGHPLGKFVMIVILLLALLPLILAILGVHLPAVGCHPSGCGSWP